MDAGFGEKRAGLRHMVLSLFCGADVLRTAGRGMAICRDGRTGGTGLSWIWLQVAKLRSHFGNQEGALEAVRRGLALSRATMNSDAGPGDREAGAPLETMEYHWIDPDCDQALQDGLDERADDKRRAISCIVLDPESLKWVRAASADGLGCGCALLQFSYAGSGSARGSGVPDE